MGGPNNEDDRIWGSIFGTVMILVISQHAQEASATPSPRNIAALGGSQIRMWTAEEVWGPLTGDDMRSTLRTAKWHHAAWLMFSWEWVAIRTDIPPCLTKHE